MKLYLARHGETNNNRINCIGNFGDQLSELGRRQAEELAKRVGNIGIDIILASSYRRAQETAEIVAQETGKIAQTTDLLGEKKWPSQITGKPLADPEVVKMFELLREKNNVDPGWHFSDEENFCDVKNRARLFIEYISDLDGKNILAISHGYFIKMVIATMMHGEGLSYDIFRNFFHFITVANASLTLCAKEQTAWKLVTLNDLK